MTRRDLMVTVSSIPLAAKRVAPPVHEFDVRDRNGRSLTRVVTAPAVGEYVFDAGAITLNVEQAEVRVTYAHRSKSRRRRS